MCRFKPISAMLNPPISLFQYIICVGSRKELEVSESAISQVSIHHMCRFKLGGTKLQHIVH